MNRLSHILASIMVALTLVGASLGMDAKSWESIKPERIPESKVVVKDTDIEIRAGKGCILVIASRPIQIKVYSILGQVISQENLPAGTSRLDISTHGIFIVKSGDITCKVAL